MYKKGSISKKSGWYTLSSFSRAKVDKLEFRLISNVTNLVVIENGHPTFESLCMVMQETGEEYLRAKGAIE